MLDFNPLSPHGERRAGAVCSPLGVRFQSTLPAWGETMLLPTRPIDSKISIHSPRMGRDLKCLSHFLDFRHISIHSPRMGRDPTDTMGLRLYKDFNPLSPHGERRRGIGKWMKKAYISIHSPRMGRDRRARNQPKNRAISIHSPRMGRDCIW